MNLHRLNAELDMALANARSRDQAARTRESSRSGSMVNLREAEIAAREAQEKREFEESVKVFEALGMTRRGAEAAARGREENR